MASDSNSSNQQEINLTSDSGQQTGQSDFNVQDKNQTPFQNNSLNSGAMNEKAEENTIVHQKLNLNSNPSDQKPYVNILDEGESSRGKMFTIVLAIIAMLFVFGTGLIIFKYFQNYLNHNQPNNDQIATVNTQTDNDDNPADYEGIDVSGIRPTNTTVNPTPINQPSVKPSVTISPSPTPKVTATPSTLKPSSSIAPKAGWHANDYKKGDIKAGTHKVVSGDTLWEIAEAAYGNGGMWTKIAQANNIGSSAHGYPLITPGMTLTIPAI